MIGDEKGFNPIFQIFALLFDETDWASLDGFSLLLFLIRSEHDGSLPSRWTGMTDIT